MNTRRITAIAVTLAAAAFAGGAIAASSDDPETAILNDAAKRLDVTPERLREALAAAHDAQLDQAVKDGKLTQEQADAVKARRKADGSVLGIGPRRTHRFHVGPGEHRRGGPGFRMRKAGFLADAAKALGLSEAQLIERLKDGKTLAAIAKAEGKSVADVKSAVKAAAAKRLDADVKAGRITKAQRDEIVEHVGEHVDRFAEGGLRHRGRRFHGGPRLHGAPKPPPPPMEHDGASYEGAVFN